MKKYILKRILLMFVLLFGVSLIAFFIVRLIPGDTVTIMLGARYNEEQAAILRMQYGLDKSILTQYLIWIKNVLSGDLGYSFFTKQPVIKTILSRLPVTIELASLSLLFATIVGIPAGVISAVRKNGLVDQIITSISMLGISIPNFWLGTLIILLFSLTFKVLPSSGYVKPSVDLLMNIKYMIMPSIALSFAVSAVVMRMSRSAMLEVINKDYIELAKMKGVTSRKLIFVHALKNAMIPIITVIGIQAGYLLGGSVVVEQVFSLPGIGRLVLESINNRDYILLQGIILFISAMFVIINLIVDILYALVNPKITY